MKMRIKFALASTLFCALSPGARASGPTTLTGYFEQKLKQVDGAMQDPALGLGEALKRARLTDFNPEFTAQASFGISDVFQISVAPELDLVFVPPLNMQAVSSALPEFSDPR